MKGFLLMEGLLKLVGMKTLFRLGRMAGGAAWHLLPKRRKIVERNLRIVLDPALRGRELKKLDLRMRPQACNRLYRGAEEAGQGEFPADDRQFPVFRQDGHSDG